MEPFVFFFNFIQYNNIIIIPISKKYKRKYFFQHSIKRKMDTSYQRYYFSVLTKIDLSEEERSVEEELNNIIRANSNYGGTTMKNEITDLLISKYIEEVWISELSDQCEGVDKPTITDYLVESKGFVRPYEKDIDIRLWTKLRNIYFAVKQYLIHRNHDDYDDYDDADDDYQHENSLHFCFAWNNYSDEKKRKSARIPILLSIDLIKQIHSVIGKDVIEDAGSFRKTNVGGLSSSVIYATAKTIPERLEELIYFFNSMITQINKTDENEKDRLLSMITLSSFFFSEFLLIHPFINGNGRTARILLNYILQREVCFPFSIYLDRCGDGGDRDRCGRRKYIDAVERRNYDKHPTEITKYILHACNRSASTINWIASTSTSTSASASDPTNIEEENPLLSINTRIRKT